ncbi:MAG: NUDIX hydrolase [Puniceicoccaceae bacterium 5H]|nr:MAG: NUDIX hydrolase [Puniceicoccaceae bacterium 5H]
MAEEIFDVVDRHDAVISQAPRTEVHARGLLHRAVHVLVFNARGEIFLQQRARTKDTFPSRWDSSAAGHVAAGDTYLDTAPREVKEELGVKIRAEALEPLFYLEASEQTGQEFVWVYGAAHEGPFTLQASELEGGGWFAPEVVDWWVQNRPQDHAPSFVLIWQRWRGK